MNLLCRKISCAQANRVQYLSITPETQPKNTKTYHFLLHVARRPQNHHFKPYDKEGKCERALEGLNQTMCLLFGVHIYRLLL
jgi:hypothetical protein